MPSAMIFCGLDLIMPGFMQAQREKPHRVLGIEFPPTGVGNFGEHTHRIFVVVGTPSIDQLARHHLGIGNADIGALERRAQNAFGRNRILLDIVRAGNQHAAKVLRPGPIPN